MRQWIDTMRARLSQLVASRQRAARGPEDPEAAGRKKTFQERQAEARLAVAVLKEWSRIHLRRLAHLLHGATAENRVVGPASFLLVAATLGTALTLTTASNVSVIVATSPLFTGLIMAYALKKGGLGAGFFVGFVLAIAGIALISFSGESAAVAISPNGSDAMAMGLLGCLLALSNAIMCAIYSVLSQRASMGGHDSITVTRRFFFWGLVGMVPFLAFTGFDPDWGFLAQPIPLANLLFLGLGASAACYAMWNAALKRLGPVTAMAYQYLVPVITIAISVSVLGEPLTPAIVAGAVLTIAGLVVSQLKALLKGKKEPADRD